MMIPIGLTIINSGSTVSINVNWSESVQRSRPTSAPPTRRTRSKSAADVQRRERLGGLLSFYYREAA